MKHYPKRDQSYIGHKTSWRFSCIRNIITDNNRIPTERIIIRKFSFIWKSMFVWVCESTCVYCVCIGVHCVCVCEQASVYAVCLQACLCHSSSHVCERQKLTSGNFLNHSLSYFLKQDLLLHPALTNELEWLVSKLWVSSGLQLYYAPGLQISAPKSLYVGTDNLNSRFHASMTEALLTMPSSQPWNNKLLSTLGQMRNHSGY